jgi:iron complex outermembrane receptor protein
MTAARALAVMLRGTPLRARRVAPAAYLIELAPQPKAPRRLVRPAPSRAPAFNPDVEAAEEIVVTATKRDIPLYAYPGGVEIVDGDSLSFADGLLGTAAIENRVASVASTHLGPGRNKLFIRGIADSSFVGPTQATVGQYWGTSRISYSAPDPNLKLYNVQSIEVLEGPQGTLYGAGSLGGVVRVVPRAPSLIETGGSAWGGLTAVQHGDPGMDGGAILNIPIVEGRLGFRALAFGSVEGGYIDDVGRKLKDVNRVRTIGGRAALRLDPGGGWTVDLNGVGQRIDGDDSQYAERNIGGLGRSSALAQPFRNDYWLADLVARKRWEDIELTSSLGYARQYVFELFEGPALTTPGDTVTKPLPDAPPAGFSQANRISMLTVETRLSRRGPEGSGWLIAASLLSNDARVNRRMGLVNFIASLAGVTNRAEEATIYGEATLRPLPRFTQTLGGRLTRSRLSGSSEDAITAVVFRNDPDAQKSRSERRFLPSTAIAWRPTGRLTVFARYQQGFRPGGIAVRQDYIQRFQGDRVSTVEGGLRYSASRLDLSASASWSRWTHIQADLIDGFGFPTTANIGNGEVLSVGLSSRWHPFAGLELDAAIYLNDSQVTDRDFTILSATAGPLSDGERLPNVADATGRIGFVYSAAIAQRTGLSVSGYGRYVGKSTLGVGPILGRLQGDYLDTGIEARIGSPQRGLSISVTNLLDARGNRSRSDPPSWCATATRSRRCARVRRGSDLI